MMWMTSDAIDVVVDWQCENPQQNMLLSKD
jgi:hypothetical protein